METQSRTYLIGICSTKMKKIEDIEVRKLTLNTPAIFYHVWDACGEITQHYIEQDNSLMSFYNKKFDC